MTSGVALFPGGSSTCYLAALWAHYQHRAACTPSHLNPSVTPVYLYLSGRRILRQLRRGFDTVLVDEACQCSEVAVLQPLVYGASKVGGDQGAWGRQGVRRDDRLPVQPTQRGGGAAAPLVWGIKGGGGIRGEGAWGRAAGWLRVQPVFCFSTSPHRHCSEVAVQMGFPLEKAPPPIVGSAQIYIDPPPSPSGRPGG